MRFLLIILALSILPVAAGASAVNCESLTEKGVRYTVCEVDLTQEELRLWHRDASGTIYGNFDRLEETLRAEGRTLTFAMNGGMYQPDRSAVGLYVEDGQELAHVITRDTSGNFGLLPNGVFCIEENSAAVIETKRFAANPPPCLYASQSGPMLLIDGKVHPEFTEGSDSRYIRNGVGVNEEGTTAYFVVSSDLVNFYDFATMFRDRLNTPNALYIDGNVSRLYAPSIGRSDFGPTMGPIVGTVADIDAPPAGG